MAESVYVALAAVMTSCNMILTRDQISACTQDCTTHSGRRGVRIRLVHMRTPRESGMQGRRKLCHLCAQFILVPLAEQTIYFRSHCPPPKWRYVMRHVLLSKCHIFSIHRTPPHKGDGALPRASLRLSPYHYTFESLRFGYRLIYNEGTTHPLN